uniref:Uncharacterized protein n=1 Tax=Sphaerodactylus townsendi TaxID=933632 RepID=A0ACB8F3X3_9SAUR
MYEGHLQHDAQEVLQCILGHIEKTCQLLKEELKHGPLEESAVQLENCTSHNTDSPVILEEVGTVPIWQGVEDCEDKTKGKGKRKSDMEDGNKKKKSKVSREKNEVEENHRQTRSKRKALEDKPENQVEATIKYPMENESTKPTQKKSRLKLNWLKSSSNQPSILSKFCSLGKLSTNLGFKDPIKEIETREVTGVAFKNENDNQAEEKYDFSPVANTSEKETEKPYKTGTELANFNLVEKLFQGQLVLRTRCLECERFTERREDFQDISVPVQKDELSKVEESSEKAERSLLFDKMPEVITIHLKCFAATGLECDCYGGLSKINTPLLTPLKLSLDDWSIKPANETYGLFAVVMHSGITISSGHYTASVKITNLDSLELDKENFISDPLCEMIHFEPLNEQEARTVTEQYNDGEVSFRVSGNTRLNKGTNQKNIEAVGLLGGQKSKTTCDFLSSKTPHSGNLVTEARNAEWKHANGIVEVEHLNQTAMASNGLESKAVQIMQNLKEYEGKWLLFDDSEVKVTEEKDFLNSLSPVSSTTSTPYLLFYKKIAE